MPNVHAHRLTARVLLVDRTGRILLFLTAAPDSSRTARWITPGGGVDAGETFADAARRELFEETGLVVDDLGAAVWAHDFEVEWDAADHDTGHAEFFVHVTDRFTPSSAHWTDEERVDVLEHRWWSLAELEADAPPIEPAELIELARAHVVKTD